jgi:hypothetical protein
MFASNAAVRSVSLVSILCFSIGLYASAASAQQNDIPEFVDIVGGSTANAQLYWLDFDQDEAVTINTAADQSANNGLNSFVLFNNTCGIEPKQDIIATDNNRSTVLRYAATEGLRSSERICSSGSGCPGRPAGLSSSKDQEIALVSTGVGNSRAGVWKAEATCSENSVQFAFKGGDGFTYRNSVDNRDTSASRMADTEYAYVDGGGLEAGNLLVLIESPPMIARVDQIGPGGKGTPLVPKDFFGRNTPTSMAFVPGTATGDLSEILLVTLSNGQVRQLTFKASTSGTPFLFNSTNLGNSTGLFQNPRGIAAGNNGAELFMIVADQNQGQYFKAELEVASQSLRVKSGTLRSLKDPVQAPMGIAIYRDDDVVSLAECFQPPYVDDDGVAVASGCAVGNGFGELHFPQIKDGVKGNEGVRVEQSFLRDKDNNTDRNADGFLEFELDGLTFLVPPTCRGFPTVAGDPRFGDDAGEPHLVLLDAELRNFEVTPLNFIQVTERTKDLLNKGASCGDTYSRVYYHPSKDQDYDLLPAKTKDEPPLTIYYTLFDTTFSCANPSRSIVIRFSPVVMCRDPFAEDRWMQGANVDYSLHRNDVLNPQIRLALDAIKDANDEVTDPELQKKIQELVVSISNPSNSGGSANGSEQARIYFESVAERANEGALLVFRAKKDYLFPGEGPPKYLNNPMPGDAYSILVSRFLWLGFYATETGLLTKYYPPAAFCETIYDDPNDPDKLFPELPDVECAIE